MKRGLTEFEVYEVLEERNSFGWEGSKWLHEGHATLSEPEGQLEF